MSQTREEIIELRKQRINLLKWKIGSVGAVFAVAFKILSDQESNLGQFAVLAIPILCLSIDAICIDISIRIHFLGRFLESLKPNNASDIDSLSEAKALEDYLVRYGIPHPEDESASDQINLSNSNWIKHLNIINRQGVLEILRYKGFIYFELVSIFWSSIAFDLTAALSVIPLSGKSSAFWPFTLVALASLACFVLTNAIANHFLAEREAMNKWNVRCQRAMES